MRAALWVSWIIGGGWVLACVAFVLWTLRVRRLPRGFARAHGWIGCSQAWILEDRFREDWFAYLRLGAVGFHVERGETPSFRAVRVGLGLVGAVVYFERKEKGVTA